MKLNRKTRRAYYRYTAEGRRMSKLNFLHPEKVELRRNNILSGKEMHDSFEQSIQERIAENNAELESKIIESLKEKGLNKSEIDNYMDLWSSVKMWPKPKNHIEVKRELKSLSRQYNFYA
jgi:hypothetical protein